MGRGWLAKPRPATPSPRAFDSLALRQTDVGVAFERPQSSAARKLDSTLSSRQARWPFASPLALHQGPDWLLRRSSTAEIVRGYQSADTSVAQRQERDSPKVEAGGSSPPGRANPSTLLHQLQRPMRRGGHPCNTIHHSHVLQLDIQGTPQAWISLEHAATARGHGLGGLGGRRRPTGHAAWWLQRRARPAVGHRYPPDHGAHRRVQGQPVRRGAGVQQGQAVPA